MARKDKESSGTGRGLALILILIEVCGAFYLGMTLLESFGSESLRSMKFSAIGAGIAGVISYFVLHAIPGIRWFIMLALVCLWAFVAYTLSLKLVGDQQEAIHRTTHKGPYIAAAIAALFRAIMYRGA